MNTSQKSTIGILMALVLVLLAIGVLTPVQAAATTDFISDFPPHPILSDLQVRQAMAYCTDKVALAQAGYPLLTDAQAEGLVMNSFIPSGSEYYAGDANITIYPYDPAQGRALLEAAGWTLQPGADFRTNAAGDVLSIQASTTSAAFRQAYMAVWEQQMRDCGISIVRLHAPASWWFGDQTGLARRDFEMGAFAWVGQADPGGYTLWACDQIPQPGNNWEGQNYMGWCNPTADTAIKTAVNSLDLAARKEAYKVVQAQYTQDVPALPLFNRTEAFSAYVHLTGFAPTTGEEYYVYNTQDWAIPGRDTIVIGSTQQPTSLYTLIDNNFASNLASYPVNPRAYTSLNFTFEPQLVTELSTLENGDALNNNASVQVGDIVIDSNGEVVQLAIGTHVIDASGAVVVFNGTPIQMKQLVVTYKFRNDLKWSDGTALSIADFELGHQTECDHENGATTFYTCDRTKQVTFASDGTNTYTVTYIPGYQDPLYFLPPYGFYPAHRIIQTPGPYLGLTLAQVPAKDWPDLLELTEKPLGVGPYKIKQWIRGEKIVFEANPYAPADLAPATPNLIIYFVTPQNAEAQLLAGGVDLLGSETLGGLTDQLVAAEAAGVVKNYIIRSGTWEHIDINLNDTQSNKPVRVNSDVRVRQAMAYCTDKAALAQAGYPLLTREQAESLVMNSFIPNGTHYYAGDDNLSLYPYDPAQGRALLQAAGWTLKPGDEFRTNAAGEVLNFQLTSTNAAFRQAYAAVWEQQMRDCGISIVRMHASAAWWFGDQTGLARREFDLGAFAWVAQANPGGYSLFACDQIPQPENNWDGQNYMGWCNPAADAAIKTAVNTLDDAVRQEAYKTVQAQYTQDVPSLPLFHRTDTFSANADLQGFAPTLGEQYYVYNAQEWTIPGSDTIVMGFTQEPASLYTLLERSYVSNLAYYLVNPPPYTSLNYTFEPNTLIQIPTLENGDAVNQTVTVNTGDKVVDLTGYVVELANGIRVLNASGAEVVFDGTPIQMKRLEVTYRFRNDLKWSDGTALSIADFELGHQTECDRENGSWSFYDCDRTQQVTFANDGTNTYTVTYVPGHQDALYFLPPYGFYPAHRVIQTPGPYLGMTLANVPAKDWPTLFELTENPIGVGSYKIKQWVKGVRIEYEVNPYAPADLTPTTPNLIFQIVSPESAEAQLLAGDVDLLDLTTLAGLSSALVNGENEGLVKNYIIRGASWEHIDIKQTGIRPRGVYLPAIFK